VSDISFSRTTLHRVNKLVGWLVDWLGYWLEVSQIQILYDVPTHLYGEQFWGKSTKFDLSLGYRRSHIK